MSAPTSSNEYLIDLPLLTVPRIVAKTEKLCKPRRNIGAPGSVEREAFKQSQLFKLPIRRPALLQPFSTNESFDLLRKYMTATDDAKIVFVCIDMDVNMEKEITEIGIATLDIQKFRQSSQTFSLQPTTQNHRLESKHDRAHRAQKCSQCKDNQLHHRDSFIWGDSSTISQQQIKQLIEENVKQATKSGEHRNVILVSHSFYGDMGHMHELGIDFLDKQKFPKLLGLMDTQILACSLIRRSEACPSGYTQYKSFKLAHLAQYLDIPCCNLHVAGNDANLTLKALLLLACVKFKETNLTLSSKEALSRYILLSREAIPPRPKIDFRTHKNLERAKNINPAHTE